MLNQLFVLETTLDLEELTSIQVRSAVASHRATYGPGGIRMAYALIAADLAECHSFVQVCDQDEMRLAYLTIFILLCLLFCAGVCIGELYCPRKTSVSQSSSTVQSEPRPESTVGVGNSWISCKDIFVSNRGEHYQLEASGTSVVHTKRKYHIRRDCPALKNSHVVQISLCKFCENRTK